jgi:protein tyrosine phosphatase (PTP) superfamily phosphohydrolase (DUF442 family)
MSADLHWITGPWSGKLALAARPRGGDWLDDEMTTWKRSRIDAIVSLLTPDEEREFQLEQEGSRAEAHGMEFLSLPIRDRQVPDPQIDLNSTLHRINALLSSGRNVLVHCRQGIGRTGLVASALLINKGMAPEAAVELVSAARGMPVPETSEQRCWIDEFAAHSRFAQVHADPRR